MAAEVLREWLLWLSSKVVDAVIEAAFPYCDFYAMS